jgi:hydrogenase maturation protease
MTVLVAGIGNLFSSDDGFGPEVVRRMGERADDDVRVVDYGIRGMHLAYDLLDGYDALVIVDAVPRGEPGEITVLEVGPDDYRNDLGGADDFDPHGMNPVAVLASLGALGGTLPPTYVVGCRPASTADGIGLGEAVAGAVPLAVETVDRLLDRLLRTQTPQEA